MKIVFTALTITKYFNYELMRIKEEVFGESSAYLPADELLV